MELPSDKYAVCSSAVLALRGIRECRDLDIVVGADFFKELLKKFDKNHKVAAKESLKSLLM